jgi:hypothetical protein
MIAALTYLSQLIEGRLELQMRRAAIKIRARQQLFPQHVNDNHKPGDRH